MKSVDYVGQLRPNYVVGGMGWNKGCDGGLFSCDVHMYHTSGMVDLKQ